MGFCGVCCGGCGSCLLITVVSLLSSVTYWGYLIYGGVQWGRWKEGMGLVAGRPYNMTQAMLAMWICSLVLPLLAPFICGCVVLAWTSGSRCDQIHALLLRAAVDASLLRNARDQPKLQRWLLQHSYMPAGGEERLIDDTVCKEVFKVLLAFTIMSCLLYVFIPLLVCCFKGLYKAIDDSEKYE